MSDLTDRMRTCAAYIRDKVAPTSTHWTHFERAVNEAAELLDQAAGELEQQPPDLGEPMELIEQIPQTPNQRPAPGALAGGRLPARVAGATHLSWQGASIEDAKLTRLLNRACDVKGYSGDDSVEHDR